MLHTDPLTFRSQTGVQTIMPRCSIHPRPTSGQYRAASIHPTYDFIRCYVDPTREHPVATSPGRGKSDTAAPLLYAAVVIAMRPPGRSR
jgi:hypothetical protein